MAVKPVVYDDSTSKHRPLGSGERMDGLSASSIISSDSGNLIQTGADGLAYVSGSGIADPAADNLIEAAANGRLKLTAARVAEWLDGHPQDAAALAEALRLVSGDSGNFIDAGSDGGAYLGPEQLSEMIAALSPEDLARLASAVSQSPSVTASGATEPRSLGDHLADDLVPEDFGAAGDGETDDTAAFEALERVRTGTRIDLHGKTYRVYTPPYGNYYYNGYWNQTVSYRGSESSGVVMAYDDNVHMQYGSVHSLGSGTSGRNYCVLNDSPREDLWKTNLKNVVAIGENTLTKSIAEHSNYLSDYIAIGRGVMSEEDMTDNPGHNIGIGQFALHELSTGDRNIAIGSLAMLCSKTAYKTIAIGRDCAQTVIGGGQNVFIGYQCIGGAGLSAGSTHLEAQNSVRPQSCVFIGSHAGVRVSGVPRRCTVVGAWTIDDAKSISNSTIVGCANARLVGYDKSYNQKRYINYQAEYYDIDVPASYSASGTLLTLVPTDVAFLQNASAGMGLSVSVPGLDGGQFKITEVGASYVVVDAGTDAISGRSGSDAYIETLHEAPKTATFTADSSRAVITPDDSAVVADVVVGCYVFSYLPGIGYCYVYVVSKTASSFTVQLTGSYIDGTSGSALVFGVETDEVLGYDSHTVNRCAFVGELQFSKATSIFGTTAVGSQIAGFSSERGTFNRTEMVGYMSGRGLNHAEDSVLVGSYCARYADDAYDGIAIGHLAGNGSDYIRNSIVIGDSAGFASGATYNSVVIGDSAAHCLNGPTDRTDLNSACRRVVALGFQSMLTMQDGSTSAAALHDSVALGPGSKVSGSDQVQLGDVGSTTYAYGAVQDRSDARDKADVRDTVLGLGFVKALRPVDFRWDYRDSYIDVETLEDGTVSVVRREKDGSRKRNRFHHGFIAQEVKAVMDAQGIDFGGYQDHKVNGGCDVLTIGYEELIAPLVKAVQELDARLGALESR